MGLFTEVIIPECFLPEKYKEFNEWQTYEIVERQMGTIEIFNDGTMVYTKNEFYSGSNESFKLTNNNSNGNEIVNIVASNGMDVNSKKHKLILAKLEIKNSKAIQIFDFQEK